MREDGYINGTMLCKAGGKKLLADYNRNKQTKKYLEELSINIGIKNIIIFDIIAKTKMFFKGRIMMKTYPSALFISL